MVHLCEFPCTAESSTGTKAESLKVLTGRKEKGTRIVLGLKYQGITSIGAATYQEPRACQVFHLHTHLLKDALANLSSRLRARDKKTACSHAVEVHIFNPSIWEAEAGGSL